MPSTKTTPVVVRLPNDIAAKVKANAVKRGISVSEYLADILVLQVGRKR